MPAADAWTGSERSRGTEFQPVSRPYASQADVMRSSARARSPGADRARGSDRAPVAAGHRVSAADGSDSRYTSTGSPGA